MNRETDLDFMLSEMGVRVTAAGGVSFKALFDMEQAQFDKDGEPVSTINMPMLFCQESDLKKVGRDTSLTVNGKGTFLVDSIEPDGTGVARILLQRFHHGA